MAFGPWVCTADLPAPVTLGFALPEGHALPCMVADGLGGHAAGQTASRLAVASLLGTFWTDGAAPDDLQSAAEHGLHEANRLLYQHMGLHPECLAMGTTLAGVLIRGEDLAVFNVGDSRVYRAQAGELTCLSIDDVPDSEARRGLILQCLGGSPGFVQITPHVLLERWQPGRRYLLCTDGLYDAVPPQRIAALLAAPGLAAVGALAEAALRSGANDNLSFILLERA
jgi:serine/threonine protein phosphatase PrpC